MIFHLFTLFPVHFSSNLLQEEGETFFFFFFYEKENQLIYDTFTRHSWLLRSLTFLIQGRQKGRGEGGLDSRPNQPPSARGSRIGVVGPSRGPQSQVCPFLWRFPGSQAASRQFQTALPPPH